MAVTFLISHHNPLLPISPQVTDDDLRSVFRQCGHIQEITYITDKESGQFYGTVGGALKVGVPCAPVRTSRKNHRQHDTSAISSPIIIAIITQAFVEFGDPQAAAKAVKCVVFCCPSHAVRQAHIIYFASPG